MEILPCIRMNRVQAPKLDDQRLTNEKTKYYWITRNWAQIGATIWPPDENFIFSPS